MTTMTLKAGLKKESMFFWRTFRSAGVLIAFAYAAFVDTLLIRMLPALLRQMPAESTAGLSAYMTLDIRLGMTSFVGDITQIGLLVLLLCLMAAAGGEQKKKSTILPQVSGLTPTEYVLPKFIYFPALALCAVFVFTLLAYGFCTVLFQDTLPIGDVLVTALCLGLYMAFLTSLLLTFGLSTGKAGIGVAVVCAFAAIMTSILNALDVNRYNPFALYRIAAGLSGGPAVEVIVTILITVVLIGLLALLTIGVLWDKKVDNRGSERL